MFKLIKPVDALFLSTGFDSELFSAPAVLRREAAVFDEILDQALLVLVALHELHIPQLPALAQVLNCEIYQTQLILDHRVALLDLAAALGEDGAVTLVFGCCQLDLLDPRSDPVVLVYQKRQRVNQLPSELFLFL